MSESGSSKAASKRSEKLRREALNCVDIAVRENEPGFAAILIDEALKLSKRARELDGPALFGPPGGQVYDPHRRAEGRVKAADDRDSATRLGGG